MRFAQAEIPLHTLTNLSVLLEVAREHGLLDEHAVTVLEDWRADPYGWSEAHSE
nr:hypothetical protein [Rhodothermus marinus]